MNAAFLALFFVPLVIGVKELLYLNHIIIDVFTWYKAALVLVLGAIAAYQRLPRWWAVAIIALACVCAYEPDYAWWGFPNQYLGGAALIALLALGANPPSEENVRRALTWGSIPISLSMLIPQLIPWDLIGRGYELHIDGINAATLYNANYVGFYAAMVIPVLFGYRHRRPECVVAMVLLVAALIASKSLAGAVATTVGVSFVLWYEGMRWLAFVPFELGVLYLVIRWKPDFGGRLPIWRTTVSITRWFGSGPGIFPYEYLQVEGAELVDKPHSMYLQLAHAFGWVGLGATLLALSRWRPRSVPLAAGLVAGLVAGLTNDLYIGVAPILFILYGASKK